MQNCLKCTEVKGMDDNFVCSGSFGAVRFFVFNLIWNASFTCKNGML
jgi:hypothetical protein